MNIYGATLGLGLEIVPEANSKLITADASASGDASTTAQTLNFEFGEPDPKIANVAFDNFSSAGDVGEISLNDFTYYLNNFGIQLN
ncbi:hypothetical protein NL529_28525, partial [Klebsiella pneumoniae]|nr:hypothetical protein [Klebsiella pneumoniae]